MMTTTMMIKYVNKQAAASWVKKLGAIRCNFPTDSCNFRQKRYSCSKY